MQRRGFLALLGGALLMPRLAFAARKQISSALSYKGADDPDALRGEIERLSDGGLLCVMFVTDWCPNCKAQDSYFTMLIRKYGALRVFAVDVERFPAINRSFPRQGPVPDNYFFYEGRNIGGFLGAAPSAKALDGYIQTLATKNGIALKG